MLLTEKLVNTDTYAGRCDIVTGIEDFESDVEYNDELHQYKLNGVILPSVTQTLDDGSFKNLNAYMQKIVDYACLKGSLVHKEVEEYLVSGDIGFTFELQEFIKLYHDNIDVFETKAIFDVKTFNKITKAKKDKTRKQCEMYSGGVEYLTKEKIEDFYIIYLPPNAKGQLIKL